MRRRWLLLIAVPAAALVGALGVGVWWSLQGTDPTVVLRADPVERPAPPANAPNVLLVIGCTVRRDQVGAYGGPEGVTPFLDGLAADGVLVEDPIAAGPWTRVASAAIVTGQHAVTLGMVEPGPNRNDRALPDEALTLAEVLRDAGWHTIGFTANPNLNAVFGFHQGFDAYKQMPALWREDDVKLSTRRALRGLLDLVADAPRRPVYLQAMLIDAHSPYVADPADGVAWARPGEPPVLGEYRAALHRFDRAVAQLWTGLEGQGWSRDDTIVVVVSDHGEGLNVPKHHGKGHGRFLSPSAVHAVWVAWGAGIARGHRVSGVASQVDVVPSVLGMLGVPAPATSGVDLSAALAGGTDRTGRDVAWTDTWFLDASRAGLYTDERACQRAFGERRSGAFVEGCFDRALDPTHARPARDAALERRLGEWRRHRMREMIAAQAASPERAPEGLAAQLEALGYAEGPVDEADPPLGEE